MRLGPVALMALVMPVLLVVSVVLAVLALLVVLVLLVTWSWVIRRRLRSVAFARCARFRR